MKYIPNRNKLENHKVKKGYNGNRQVKAADILTSKNITDNICQQQR